MLSYSDFSIEDIGMHKTALFIVIQDKKKTYHSLVTILIKQIYETLIDVAQNHGGKLPVRTNFLLDEFANMPPLKDVTTMITAARSRQMRFTMIIQNFAQLNEVYGEQNAETIKGNAGNLIYLISTELRALEEISKMCGEVKVKSDKEGKPDETRPLITISDLQKLKMNEVIIRRLRMAPFKTKLTPDYKMNWGREFPKADIMKITPRERREVKVFDIREFVKEKKKQNNPFANMSDSGGFPGFPSNPFGGGDSFKPPFPPLFSDNKPSVSPQSNSIDVDKILANLDAKIAEIEAEEKKIAEEEAKEQNKLQSTPSPAVENLDDDASFKDFLNTFNDEDFKTIPNAEIKEETNEPSNIDELIDKIKEKNIEPNPENIKPNMDLKEENKYQEVSDDEFFDDFFDE